MLLSLLLLGAFGSMQAQDTQVLIDNLKATLKTKPDAKKTASIYSDLTWYYSSVAIDSALYYGGKALQESKKLGDSTLIAQVYSDIGAVYFNKGEFQKSKESYLSAYTIRKARKDAKGLAKINNNLANIYERTFQYQLAMQSFLGALNYFESIDDQRNVNIIKGNIGLVLNKLKNYPKAISYISQVVRYQEQQNLPDGLCISCLNLGNAYLQLKDTLKALQQYNKSLEACTKIGNNKGISSALSNIGSLKSDQKKSKKALSYFTKSQQIRDVLNSDLDKASLQLKVAKEAIDTHQFANAKAILDQVKPVFEKVNSKENLLLTYKLLIPLYAYLKQPDSVGLYTEKYTLLKEKLTDNYVLKQSFELETKYQTAKKEKLLLQKEKEAQEQRNLLLAISALAFFIALIGFLIYRQQKLKNRQQEQEFQLKSAIAQIEAQNQLQEQRLTISRDLHDNIGAQLTFIISSVDTIKYAFDIQNPKLDSKLQHISSFTKSTIVELRDTIWAMNSNEITFEDLRARILNFIENAKIAKETIDFEFKIDAALDQLELSSVVGMNLYRTLQEAVNNALKYANPKKIAITVQKIENALSVNIQDDGVGFDAETVVKGNGLLNMQNRIESLGGIFTLKSELGKGTTISILVNL